MKLARYIDKGVIKPALVDQQGRLHDISSVKADVDASMLSENKVADINRLNPDDFPIVEGEPELATPYDGISKYICIGLNYKDHAEEANMAIPEEPVIFLKASNAINGANTAIIHPPKSTQLDFEVELGIVIGQRATHVEEKDALEYVAGYCVINDVSARDFQLSANGGGQWDKGKGCDTFGPVGPWLVSKDEIPDVQNLSIWLKVNGELRQQSNTKDMIFGVNKIVSYVSQFMTLYPGDIIATGTPAGVGIGRKPPVFGQIGDVVTLGIDGLGEQRQTVVEFEKRD
ncbi:MAG: 2-hydroxyhepta-2,4-diene-1,7-dioate isomerase [Piscirickettsiaceae bacterium]|nr:MAG: 2-hydroxyhepta-2,4-diene-1,7-dioate isomerase [Piscirickettsiaceae bacterium]